jgi:hypothetical protein
MISSVISGRIWILSYSFSKQKRGGVPSFIKIYEFASRETGNWPYESAIRDWTERCSTGRPFLARFLSRSDCICREEIKFGPLTNGWDQIGNHRGRWISKVRSKLRSPLTGSLIRCYHFPFFSLGYHWLSDWWSWFQEYALFRYRGGVKKLSCGARAALES